MVPSNTDVCVSLDMDEVIEQGWQTKLKEQWRGNIGDYKYIAEWKDEAKTIPCSHHPEVVFMQDRVLSGIARFTKLFAHYPTFSFKTATQIF
jgi:hypothetical protein